MTADEIKQDIIERKRNVTLKTLKAWLEQTEKIINTDGFLGEKEQQELNFLKEHTKKRFIETQF